jgi:coproporphyrinogen III oxidase
MSDDIILTQREQTTNFFQDLRDRICAAFELIEQDHGDKNAKFKFTKWERGANEGGGLMSKMKGDIFEKVGVNFSTVYGEFSEEFRNQIPGAKEDPRFWASGVSLVAHMHSPLVPAIHFNIRHINTSKTWFGGGTDLNPAIIDEQETKQFHLALKKACDKHDKKYYPKFKAECDEYFYIKHRKMSRGVGGIFFDYLNNGDFSKDFNFVKELGNSFVDIYPKLVRKKIGLEFTPEQKKQQLIKRGFYAEFNLLYDRGTKFGLMTNGNIDAILMSLPPEANWE